MDGRSPDAKGVEGMSTFQTLIARLISGRMARAKVSAARGLGKRALVCESLEGRQLLNGAWAAAGRQAHSAQIRRFGTPPGGPDVQQGRNPGAAGALKGAAKGPGRGLAPDSPHVQAALQGLQADMKALRAKVPADLTAKIESDRAMIEEAHAALKPNQWRGPGPWRAPTPDAVNSYELARIATLLRNSGITDQRVNSVLADFKAYKRVLDGLDPALHARIAAGKAALAKDLGPGRRAHLSGAGDPGTI